MAALICDDLISVVADTLSKLAATFWGVALFIGIAAIYALGQYFIVRVGGKTERVVLLAYRLKKH
jgi:hypothetical protein